MLNKEKSKSGNKNHTSHIALHTSQKGITLIALIITIIVMLILVGVTINVAINGGLFQKAETATVETEKQAIYEQIVSNMELTNGGKISVKGTFDKVIAEFGTDKVTNINPATVEENTTEVTFSIVGKTGTYNYKISAKSVEKDPVQSQGGIQPPSQMGGLVYGKVYAADAGGFCFSERYNRFMAKGDLTGFTVYSYDKQSGTINIGGVNAVLSDDGKTITANVNGTEINAVLTDEELFTQYVPEMHPDVNLYKGIYYNESENKCISIYVDRDEHTVCYFIEENRKLSGTFPNSEITIVDNKTIKTGDSLYTLIEIIE